MHLCCSCLTTVAAVDSGPCWLPRTVRTAVKSWCGWLLLGVERNQACWRLDRAADREHILLRVLSVLGAVWRCNKLTIAVILKDLRAICCVTDHCDARSRDALQQKCKTGAAHNCLAANKDSCTCRAGILPSILVQAGQSSLWRPLWNQASLQMLSAA